MTTSDRCSNAESEGLAQVMESYARLLKTQLEGDHVGLAADYRLASRTPPGFDDAVGGLLVLTDAPSLKVFLLHRGEHRRSEYPLNAASVQRQDSEG